MYRLVDENNAFHSSTPWERTSSSMSLFSGRPDLDHPLTASKTEVAQAVVNKFFKRLIWFLEFPQSSDIDSANP